MQEETPDKRNDRVDIHASGTFPTSNKPPPIRGFLIVVATGLVFSFIQNLAIFVGSLAPFLRTEIWERLTMPESTAYHPYWRSVLLFDLASNAAIVGLNAIVIVLFSRKHRAFPKVIVLGLPFVFILIVVGYYLSGLVPAIAESPAYEKEKHALIIRFIALHIWIPYFLVSQRVKKTFIR